MAEEDPETRVVVMGVDDTPETEFAFEFYRDVLWRADDHLLLIHVPRIPQLQGSEAMFLTEDYWQSQFDLLRKRKKELEHKFKDKLQESKINARFRTEIGIPSKVLDEIADETRAVFIVVGTRGHTNLTQTLTGSVSNYLIHHASCPVVICRPPWLRERRLSKGHAESF